MQRRKDNKGRVLKDGEVYRKSDGLYMYRWTAKNGKQGGKVFSIQLFSFKKLLFRYDGLDLRGFNVLQLENLTLDNFKKR